MSAGEIEEVIRGLEAARDGIPALIFLLRLAQAERRARLRGQRPARAAETAVQEGA